MSAHGQRRRWHPENTVLGDSQKAEVGPQQSGQHRAGKEQEADAKKPRCPQHFVVMRYEEWLSWHTFEQALVIWSSKPFHSFTQGACAKGPLSAKH